MTNKNNLGICIIAGVLAVVTFALGFVLALTWDGTSESSKEPTETVQQEENVDSPNDKTESTYVGMEEVFRSGDFTYYRDVTTDVMYLEKNGYQEKSLVVMLSPRANGMPLTYSSWCHSQEKEESNE